jgi:hypothetical protein
MESGGRVTGLGILLAHLAGDYLIQSHYMAAEKVNRWWPAVAHGVTYTVPYVFVTRSPAALLTIAGTHVVIDRWRLAKHVVWLKNLAAPKPYRAPHTATGYPDDTPYGSPCGC